MGSLNDIKPLGAFVENTLRPFIDSCMNLVVELGRHDLYPHDVKKIIKNIFIGHIVTVAIQAIRDIIIAIIIAGVIWTTVRS